VSAELVVLGSGALEPAAGEAVRLPAGCAVRLDARILLFDLGFGCLRQLARAGLDACAVTDAFFTHRHPDHVGDLPALIFHLNYVRPPRGGVLRVHGPRGFASFVERLTRAHHPWLRPRGWRLQVRELEEPARAQGRGFIVLGREVPHTTEAMAYRLECPAGTFCCTGDTGPDEGLAAFARDADLLLIECSQADGPAAARRAQGHLTVSQALAIARAARARRTLLTHLSPDSERALGRVRLRRGAEFLARDHLRMPLSRP